MDAEIQAQLIRKDDRPPLGSDNGAAWLMIIAALILLGTAVTIFGPTSNGGGPTVNGSITPSPTETRQPRIYTVSYKNRVFSPTNLRIHVGDTVRFRNDSLVSMRIVSELPPTGSEAPGFDSVGEIPNGSFFAVTFAVKGTYNYHNARNTGEVGSIIVR